MLLLLLLFFSSSLSCVHIFRSNMLCEYLVTVFRIVDRQQLKKNRKKRHRWWLHFQRHRTCEPSGIHIQIISSNNVWEFEKDVCDMRHWNILFITFSSRFFCMLLTNIPFEFSQKKKKPPGYFCFFFLLQGCQPNHAETLTVSVSILNRYAIFNDLRFVSVCFLLFVRFFFIALKGCSILMHKQWTRIFYISITRISSDAGV